MPHPISPRPLPATIPSTRPQKPCLVKSHNDKVIKAVTSASALVLGCIDEVINAVTSVVVSTLGLDDRRVTSHLVSSPQPSTSIYCQGAKTSLIGNECLIRTTGGLGLEALSVFNGLGEGG